MAGVIGKSGTNREPTPLRLMVPGWDAAPVTRAVAPAADILMPGGMTALARQAWPRVREDLVKSGASLENINEILLASYCEQYALYHDCKARVESEGVLVMIPNGFQVPNPRIKIGDRAHAQMLRLMRLMGMIAATPGTLKAARAKAKEPDAGAGGFYTALRAIKG